MQQRHRAFLISDSIAETLRHAESGDSESAFNFASLVVWRVDHHKAWLSDGEWIFINHCLGTRPKGNRGRRNA